MRLKPLVRLIGVEIKLFLREPIGPFFMFGFPLLLTLVAGNTFGKLQAFDGFRIIDLVVPALIAMVIAVEALMGMPITIAEYREQKILKRLKATPLHSMTILIAYILVGFAITLISALLIVIAGKLFFKTKFTGDPLSVFVAFSLGFVSFFALGFLVSGLSPTARSARAAGMVLFFPMLFLSGIMTGREMFPELFKKISEFIPLTYVVDMMTNLWVGDALSDQLKSIAILSGMLLLCTLISIRTFRWE